VTTAYTGESNAERIRARKIGIRKGCMIRKQKRLIGTDIQAKILFERDVRETD
jgi:hypothetical protein